MSPNPLYDQTVAAEGFDPSSVSPPSSETERRRAHEVWWQQTLRKSTKPVSRRRVSKKAAS